MMDWTDRHERFFLRLISARARLYTEMVTAPAILHGNREQLLGYKQEEHPLALQIGGSEKEQLAEVARIGEDFGYAEINLNVGCPSDRVQSGRFGACLMSEPHLVASCVEAMKKAVKIPVTVKCRIGVDEQDIEKDLSTFVKAYVDAGGELLIVHARKAWLEGLSPKENRTIPELDYDRVYRLKDEFPDLTLVINGGVENIDQTQDHLGHVDGVMMGRAAYQTPYVLADVDQKIFGEETPVKTRDEIMALFMPYVEEQLEQGVPLHSMTRHILGLYHAEAGARIFRRVISENATRTGAGITVLEQALSELRRASEEVRSDVS